MKPKAHLTLRRVGNACMLVDVRAAEPDVSYVYSLNETAALLWQMLAQDASEHEMAAELCRLYDTTPAEAAADIAAQLGQWRKAGLLE